MTKSAPHSKRRKVEKAACDRGEVLTLQPQRAHRKLGATKILIESIISRTHPEARSFVVAGSFAAAAHWADTRIPVNPHYNDVDVYVQAPPGSDIDTESDSEYPDIVSVDTITGWYPHDLTLCLNVITVRDLGLHSLVSIPIIF